MIKISGYVALTAFLFVAVVALGEKAPTSPSPPKWFWGCWVVKKLLPTTGVSGLSPKQVDAIIGTRLFFRPMCARSGHTVAHSPEYSLTVLSERQFFALGYVALSQIGVQGKKVTRVQLVKPALSDLDFPGNDVFLRRTDIVINVENDFFLAERVEPSDAACTCEEPKAK